MLVELKNDCLKVGISPKGAEIHSVKTLSDNHEYMWQGDAKSWNRHAPILFPQVSATNNNKYTYKEDEYTLSSHGFARDMVFEIIEHTETKAVFSISETKDTLKVFPFCFQLMLGYELEGDILKVTYKVINKDSDNLLFSIGAHPGFICPIEDNLKFNDYKITLNKKETSQRRMKGDAVLTGERLDYFDNDNIINLEHPLFDDGALIFDDLKSDKMTLESDKGTKKIVMNFKGYPYMGIWTKPKTNANYICLEPWFGIDSTVGDSPEWAKKEGLINLDEGEEFNSFYTMRYL
ncbi:MAG: aldose 1-epimerase family protein [Spirochaetaceae bacterium]